MKKFLSLFCCGILLFCLLSGCTKPNQPSKDRLNVVATIFPPYDFTRQIAGDRVSLTLLIPPGGESHTYEPTPQDIITIQEADVFLYVGGENDVWLDEILDNIDTSRMAILRMTECVETVEEEHVEGMQTPHIHNEEDGEPDEHVWTSPVNAARLSSAIEKVLTERDPENAAFYKQNLEAYQAQLARLDSQFRVLAATARTKELIFGDRFPLRYFAEEYGFTYYAAFPGCSAESEPSAKTIAFLIDKAKADQVDTIFYIEFSNHLAADTIAGAVGAKTALFHSCHNVTLEEMQRGVTYLSLMEQNLATLQEAIGA